jgi:hypothetical protein
MKQRELGATSMSRQIAICSWGDRSCGPKTSAKHYSTGDLITTLIVIGCRAIPIHTGGDQHEKNICRTGSGGSVAGVLDAGGGSRAGVALQSHSGNMLRWAAEFPHAMAVMRVAAPDGSVSKRKFGAEQLCGQGDVGVYPSSKS